MDQGWIKSWRKLLDNQFLMHDNNAFLVFIKLLHLVNKDGEYVTGRFALAERVNLNSNTLYSVLVRLETQHLINISSNNKYSIISICNWSRYQGSDNSTLNNAATTRQQRGNNAATLNKNKELRIKNNKVTNVTMSTSQSTAEKTTYKTLFFELVEALGFSNRTILTKERLAKLKSRMSSYSPDDLRKAARALGADSRMQGDNEAGKRWGNIDYLLRTDTTVAKYLESAVEQGPSDLSEVLNNVDWQ
jgi:hypothetical protein